MNENEILTDLVQKSDLEEVVKKLVAFTKGERMSIADDTDDATDYPDLF